MERVSNTSSGGRPKAISEFLLRECQTQGASDLPASDMAHKGTQAERRRVVRHIRRAAQMAHEPGSWMLAKSGTLPLTVMHVRLDREI